MATDAFSALPDFLLKGTPSLDTAMNSLVSELSLDLPMDSGDVDSLFPTVPDIDLKAFAQSPKIGNLSTIFDLTMVESNPLKRTFDQSSCASSFGGDDSAANAPKKRRGRRSKFEGMSPEQIEIEKAARLEKNRQSARDCRRRKKGYISDLEKQIEEYERRQVEMDRLKKECAEMRRELCQLKGLPLPEETAEPKPASSEVTRTISGDSAFEDNETSSEE
jgi:hypothetical protein